MQRGVPEPDWKQAVTDHFIFKVESTGTMSPKDIVKESLRILKEKCDSFLEVLDNSMDAEE